MRFIMNVLFTCGSPFRLGFFLLVSPFLVSCASIDGPQYYTQIVVGQINVLAHRVPIPEVLADKHASEGLKKNLHKVVEMREFAVRELGLPETESFTSYVDTGKKFAQWSVTATPEFSVQPKMWCVPIVGCASHLTFYEESLAKEYEKKLILEGYDISLRGVTAYSTGGRFADPAMNTLFEMPDYMYASSIFHEKAHEELLIKSAPAFNESFAVFVEQIGQYAWTEKHYGKEFAKKILRHHRRSAEFSALIASTWRELKILYTKDVARENMRLLKQEIFAKMREKYRALKTTWGGYSGFDDWFKQPLNNARVAGTNEYGNLVLMFRKLFELSGGNFQKFYREAGALAKLSDSERSVEIQNILSTESTR